MRLIWLLLFIVFATACNKQESMSSGNNGIRYEALEYTDLSEDVVFGEGRIYIENAKPYEDMVGATMATAFEASINDNDVRISDLAIENVSFDDVYFEIFPSQADSLTYYIESVNLVMEFLGGENQGKHVAEMSSVDGPNGKVQFTIHSEDMTDWIKSNRPDVMYFEYKLRNLFSPKTPLNVKYEVFMSYDYSYQDSEDKD